MANFIIDGDGLKIDELRFCMRNILNGENSDFVDISGKDEYQLTEDETLCLVSYTGSGARWINPSLKNEEWKNDEDKTIFVNTIDSALEKIKSFNKTDELFHTTKSSDSNFKLDEIVCIKSYLSTSIDNFENSETVWIITPKKENSNARDIGNVTGNIIEKEVLFKRNTKLIVVDIKTINNKKTIYLKEV